MVRSSGGALAAALVLAICAAIGSTACGGGDHGGNPGGGDDDDSPDGGGGRDAGGASDAAANPQGPIIEVLAPTAPDPGDYAGESIVVGSRVQAVCQVEANPDTGDQVDSASVQLAAISGADVVEVLAIPTGEAGRYAATLDVGDFANGALTIRCTASDQAAEPRTNSDEVATFLDLGPRIEVLSPIAGSSYGQQVDVTFTVTADPVAADDTGAAVDGVELTAASVAVDLTPGPGNSYFASIDFDAPEFDPPLDGEVGLIVRATNSRAATAVTRTAQVPFVADSGGPAVGITEPTPGLLVGGFMDINVTVLDDSGIDSVVATIAHQYEVELEATDEDTFSGTFDTRLLDTSWVFPLVEVRARDRVGNEAAVGRIVALDNRAPLVSMDSPPMREAKCLVGDTCDLAGAICSDLFDPLGSDTADDGEVVAGLMELRVRAEDRGNGAIAPSGVVVPIAGIDQNQVAFYVLDDDAGALMVDTDDDGTCDSINPALVPTSVPDTPNEAAVVSLVAVAPSGASHYEGVLSDPFGGRPDVADDACQEPGANADTNPPSALCISSPATRVVATQLGAAAVFAVPPADAPWCVGNAFDAPATNIADGWACVAAVAPDALGNLGLSPPLRICIDHDGDGTDGVGGGGTSLASLGCGDNSGEAAFGEIADAIDRPSCTDGCVPPESFADFPFLQVVITGGL
ncbi:MAG TPA: hypothetical protein VKB80_22000 [Kofleriaceae bacterium]|nr:hypothetical protein [Kofleriaceae bacterium]